MSSVIIILKIEVSARQPLGTPLLYPEKGPQSEENRPLLSEGGLSPACKCGALRVDAVHLLVCSFFISLSFVFFLSSWRFVFSWCCLGFEPCLVVFFLMQFDEQRLFVSSLIHCWDKIVIIFLWQYSLLCLTLALFLILFIVIIIVKKT